MAIKTYKAGSSEQLSKNFQAWEFGCCSEDIKIDTGLVAYLQKIRDKFGEVHISSGYRCPVHNVAAGGSPVSNHMKGMAADIWVEGMLHEPRKIARYAEQIGVPGIGLYEGSKGQWFVHIDTRAKKCYWEGHAEKVVPTFQEQKDTFVKVQVRVLKRGMTGEDVEAMQILLNGNGFNCGTPDGSFGPATEKALAAYQKANKLDVDGSCGPATWAKLLGG